MASVGKASWMVAASVGAVEALKDQLGLCRWNYAFRSLHLRASAQLGSLSQTMIASSSSSSFDGDDKSVGVGDAEKANKFEETLMKVMLLSCWGPK